MNNQIRSDRRTSRYYSRLALVYIPLWFAGPAQAVIFYSTDDPNYNTAAPTGELADSGWQYQGRWGAFLGTPIAPQLFITAGHVGGAVGAAFNFRGIDYRTVSSYDDPNSDLRIWRICGAFPAFAPLYTASDELNKRLVVFGRGTQRGSPVTVTNGLVVELKGWLWGGVDGVQRWGENQVDAVVDGDPIGPFIGSGSAKVGLLLKAGFNAGAGPNEAHLSGGDSGGGAFIKDGSTWKLAGVNYAVDGPYNWVPVDPGFQAVIFDEGGLYKGNETKWVFTPDLPVDVPGAFYETRISSNAAWINSVLNSVSSADALPVLQSATNAAGPYADVPNAAIDPTTKTITVAEVAESQFYRLRDCGPRRITSARTNGGNLVLTYE